MKRILLLATVTTVFFTACSKDDDNVTPTEFNGQAVLNFNSMVNTDDFELNKDFTINGATYNFTQLRYWVSNVSLTNDKGQTYKVPDSYYLVEELNAIPVQEGSFEYPARKREDVTINDIPAGNYKSVTFSIGVDSVHNNNLSLQAGELSQMNGMTNISWMWHTSYIFSSLKGTMTAGGASSNITVETGLNTNYRTLTVNLPAAINISSAAQARINLDIDVTKIITGLDLAKTPVIGAAQKTEMTMVADNYAQKAIVVKSAATK